MASSSSSCCLGFRTFRVLAIITTALVFVLFISFVFKAIDNNNNNYNNYNNNNNKDERKSRHEVIAKSHGRHNKNASSRSESHESYESFESFDAADEEWIAHLVYSLLDEEKQYWNGVKCRQCINPIAINHQFYSPNYHSSDDPNDAFENDINVDNVGTKWCMHSTNYTTEKRASCISLDSECDGVEVTAAESCPNTRADIYSSCGPCVLDGYTWCSSNFIDEMSGFCIDSAASTSSDPFPANSHKGKHRDHHHYKQRGLTKQALNLHDQHDGHHSKYERLNKLDKYHDDNPIEIHRKLQSYEPTEKLEIATSVPSATSHSAIMTAESSVIANATFPDIAFSSSGNNSNVSIAILPASALTSSSTSSSPLLSASTSSELSNNSSTGGRHHGGINSMQICPSGYKAVNTLHMCNANLRLIAKYTAYRVAAVAIVITLIALLAVACCLGFARFGYLRCNGNSNTRNRPMTNSAAMLPIAGNAYVANQRSVNDVPQTPFYQISAPTSVPAAAAAAGTTVSSNVNTPPLYPAQPQIQSNIMNRMTSPGTTSISLIPMQAVPHFPQSTTVSAVYTSPASTSTSMISPHVAQPSYTTVYPVLASDDYNPGEIQSSRRARNGYARLDQQSEY